MLRGGYVDDDDESEATRLFTAKMMAEFRRAAPLPEEIAKRNVEYHRLGAVKKKLNFDETIDSFSFEPPTLPGLKTRMADAEAEIAVLRRKLEGKQLQLTDAQKDSEAKQDTIDVLRSEVTQLKIQLAHQSEDHRNQSSMNESILNRSCAEDWRSVAAKYIAWFNVARDQFNVAAKILQESRLLTRENKYKLQDAQRVIPVDLSDDVLDALNRGSVLDVPDLFDFMGVPDEVADFGSARAETVPAAPTSRFVPLSPIGPASANDSVSFLLDQSSIMNSALVNTTIDYEKDERIDRLEHENGLLKERLQLACARANKTLLLTEEKRSLSGRVRMLETQLSDAVSELEALRAASAKKMFDLADQDTQSRAVEMTDRIKRLQMRLTQQEQLLSSITTERNALSRNVSDLNEKISKQQERICCFEVQVNNLERDLSESTEHLQSTRTRLQSVLLSEQQYKHQCEQAAERIATLEANIRSASQEAASASADSTIRMTSPEPTDAGDTTQIVHMARNPLQIAHEEYLAQEQSRKRKLEEESSQGSDSKRVRDAALEEEMELLRHRLATSEREKQSTKEILENFSKKYREVTTVLTGYQIKIRDITEGLCSVASIYDSSRKEFVFKYASESGRMDLLDVGQASASQGEQWNDLMRRYIGVRQSIPAFLASVTLSLEADRDIEEPEEDEADVERTHTFSVLHHDTD